MKTLIFACLGVLFLAAPVSRAQSNAAGIAPQAPLAPQPVGAFSAEIACEIAQAPTQQPHLYARNTLTHELPRGTRLRWTYRRGVIPQTVHGDRVLPQAVAAGALAPTGVNISGMLDGQDCHMHARYTPARRQ